MRRLLNTLYVTNQEAYLRKKDDAIAAYVDDEMTMSIPFHLIDGIVLFGHARCSMGVLRACAERGVIVVLLDEDGRFCARVDGPTGGNVLLRREQFRRANENDECLALAKRFVTAKVRNGRGLMQHFVRDYPDIRDAGVAEAIEALKKSLTSIDASTSLDELRGAEGNAAHVYFGAFGSLLRPQSEARFTGRSRRPPTDPVNATLSFFYTLLGRDMVAACEAVGLDPQLGYLHSCRPGRASLALDLIEEFRAPYVDRFVLSLFNRKQLVAADFEKCGSEVRFTKKALKKAIGLWQEKKQEQISHPFLGEKMNVGLLPFIQAQLLARHLRGDLDAYPAFLWR